MVVAAALGVGSSAGAHQFECEKTVNDRQVAEVSEYPTTLFFNYRLINTHPAHSSIATVAEDPVLAQHGWSFRYPVPLTVPVGGWVEMKFALPVNSYEECKALAAEDGLADNAFDTNFQVVWPLGEDQCSTRVVCLAPPPPPPEDCTVTNTCPEAQMTRDAGFYKNHEVALQQCLDVGPVDLGSVGPATTLQEALGVLWGSPAQHRNNEPRSALDRARFLLARQYLVAHCNFWLFGAAPLDPDLMESTHQALSGTRCQRMEALKTALEAFNDSGKSLPLPSFFDPGPATPQHAQSIAHDYTQPSAQSCE
ncbi:hypothetical protein [Hyalangium rubrum]|uniref:Uncharacterized protein n=1 Tax=Hyalangium rubrum TaxID=3103134 RepID=A0ABU5GYM4_9BACT|nr:hypothetical protein [Hyalangium sp. s54d21]MDY7226296.1 hypothetical protein [Hyalangium sp. s54d21]